MIGPSSAHFAVGEGAALDATRPRRQLFAGSDGVSFFFGGMRGEARRDEMLDRALIHYIILGTGKDCILHD